MAVQVPGYPNLRYIGGAASKPAEQHVAADTLRRLQLAAQQLGGVIIDIFSGSGSPAVRGAGFAGDPHDRGIAADASINGTPIGDYPGAVDVLHRVGLRTGATDFTYQGKRDPAHVDTLNPGAVNNAAAATSGSITSPDTFWYAVETKLGLPHNRATHDFLVAWSMAEGTKARFNPLATTLREPGSTSFNSVGVQNYATPESGVQATADTIKQYPTIMAVLRGKASPFGNPSLNAELNKWVTGKSGNTQSTSYVNNVLRNYQGNPSGKSAADWFSYDLGNLYKDSGAKAAVDATLAVPRFLAKITDPAFILRSLQVIAGAVLVLVGVYLLARQVGLAADVPAPSVVPIPV